MSASYSGRKTLSYSYGGTLPPGLSIDSSSGVISGTPTTAGSYPVTITATDTDGYNGSASFTCTITNAVNRYQSRSPVVHLVLGYIAGHGVGLLFRG